MFKYILQVFSIILTISLLFFNIYISKTINFTFTFVVLLVMLIASIFIFGYRKIDKRDYKYKLILVAGLTFMLQSILYLVGTKTGYISNYSSMFKSYVEKSVIVLVFLTVVTRELIRYLVINARTNKKWQSILLQTLLIIMCILVDLAIAPKIYTFTSFTLVYEFLAMFLIPSAAKNILLNYLSIIGGYPITFVYVLIMDLYIYFLSVRPELNMLLEAVILLVFPYVVYNYVKELNNRRTVTKKREKKKENKIVTAISTIIFVILVCLVSREFKYSMIGIGSESMTGTINKGDAIIYKRYEKDEDVKNKVIVFKRNNVMIVHRVIKVYTLDGEYVYQTKGDANESADNWLVEQSDVLGIVEKRVPFIAWPSVILGEIF